MTGQESFKKRVRARMERTGERYVTTRRALLDKAAARTAAAGQERAWVAEPELGDDAVREATGRGWDEWCDLVDAWPGRVDGHGAVAAHLVAEHGVDGWWAQTITVGWERITGLRLPHQMADGTFTASRSRTVTVDHERLRSLLLDDEDREDLLPGIDTELRSRPTSKVVRLGVDGGEGGIVLVDLRPKGDGRTSVTVSHEKLTDAAEVGLWKDWWGDWLAALDEG